jgi:hypothetical protein
VPDLRDQSTSALPWPASASAHRLRIAASDTSLSRSRFIVIDRIACATGAYGVSRCSWSLLPAPTRALALGLAQERGLATAGATGDEDPFGLRVLPHPREHGTERRHGTRASEQAPGEVEHGNRAGRVEQRFFRRHHGLTSRNTRI